LDRVRAQVLTDYLGTITPPEIEQLVSSEWKNFISNTAMKNIQDSFTEQAITAFKLYTRGKTVADIAEEFETKPDSIYKYISRIKLKLVEEIKRLKVELDF